MLWGSAKQMESSVQCTRGVQRKREQHAVHKRGCAKHYGSGVQCTRGGVQSEMSAVCNAPESCKAKWERRAFARGVCNARGGCAMQKENGVQCSEGVQCKMGAACGALGACNARGGGCNAKGEQRAML